MPALTSISAFEEQALATEQPYFDSPKITTTALPGIHAMYRMTRGEQQFDISPWLTTSAVYAPERLNSARSGEEAAKDLVMLKAAPKALHEFKSLQAWEGSVEHVGTTTFTARLYDRTRPGEEETAEFELSEIDDDDLSLVAPGAVFYWDVGYLITHGGRRRASEIRFRRLPAWTREELKEARAEAAKFCDVMSWK